MWRAEVPNTLFTVRNPYSTLVYGDWLFTEVTGAHLGDVYLDGKSLYERQSLEEVRHPKPWALAKYPEASLLAWYCEVNDTKTVIWANFGGRDPRQENVEINVRPYCFWPEKDWPRLHHRTGLYADAGVAAVGAADGFAGGPDRSALEPRLDH